VLPEVSRAAGSGGGFPGGFAGGGGNAAAPPARPSYYQFGGDWVIVLRNDQPVPTAVKTGLTDLGTARSFPGCSPAIAALLLPSASLFDQQERLQQFISSRFSARRSSRQNQQFRGRPPF
jgi:hypothetical protein